jgi:hypothetical protein
VSRHENSEGDGLALAVAPNTTGEEGDMAFTDHRTEQYAAPAGKRERTADVENGLRLVELLFDKLRELDERVQQLERDRDRAA